MIRAASMCQSFLVAALALAPGAAMAQEPGTGPKLPAMPSLAHEDSAEMSKPAGLTPPPAAKPPVSKPLVSKPLVSKAPEAKPTPKSDDKKKPEPAKPNSPGKGRIGKNGSVGRPVKKVAEPSRAAPRHATGKPHAARHGTRR